MWCIFNDRFLKSSEVTWRLMLLQKKPNGSPGDSSSSQLHLVNFRKRAWVWDFAACFIPNFKFPPLLCEKRFQACVLQVFWTNWGFSKVPQVPLEISFYNQKLDQFRIKFEICQDFWTFYWKYTSLNAVKSPKLKFFWKVGRSISCIKATWLRISTNFEIVEVCFLLVQYKFS